MIFAGVRDLCSKPSILCSQYKIVTIFAVSGGGGGQGASID